MAKKGGRSKMKRIAAPSVLPVKGKKTTVWIMAPRKGKHKKTDSIPLSLLMRDVIGLTTNAKESKSIIKRGLVKVDGKITKDEKAGIGLMDIVEINDQEKKKFYQILMLEQGLRAVAINERDAEEKPKKIVGKRVLKGGKIQLSFHDGTTMIGDKEHNTNDSLFFNLKSGNLDRAIKFSQGTAVYITEGKHRGKVMKLVGEIARIGSHENEAKVIDKQGNEIVTLKKYLFLVDEGFEAKIANFSKEA